MFIKIDEPTEFGSEPHLRPLSKLLTYGIINIDKQSGPTSHQISDFVKKIMQVKKAGHSGTLDPKVTGVQPVAIGNATRIAQFLLTAPKEYICIMKIHQDYDENSLKEICKEFEGEIDQLPPVKSAVKRQWRKRNVYDLEILEIIGKEVLFRVKCEAGTYIRKLVHDIGEKLGTGAHMAQLRRTQAGPFTEQDKLVTLNDLKDAMEYFKQGNEKYIKHIIHPIENAVTHIKKCYVRDSAIESLTHGRDLAVPGILKLENFKKGEVVAILTGKGELVAMGESLMSAVQINCSESGIAINNKKVFMKL